MARQNLITSVLFLFAGLGAAVPSPSAAAGPHYRAETTEAPAAKRIVARGLLWHCDGGACVAGKGNSRPAIECAALVKKVGALRSFSVAGEAFTAAELEKCLGRSR